MAPEAWESVSLGDFLTPVSRAERVDDTRIYRLLGVRWYGNGCHLHAEIEGKKLKTRLLNRVASNDVVYNKMWTKKGAFAVATPSEDGLHSTGEYPAFSLDLARVDPGFLRQRMRLRDFVEQASGLCRGTTSRARLNPADFLRLRIALPSLPEQRKIAAILSSVDDAIEKAEAVIGQLEVVNRALLENLLGELSGGRVPKFAENSRAWQPMVIGDLCDLSGGNGFKPSDWSSAGLPIIRIQNLNGSQTFNYFSPEPLPEWIVEPGELLFAWAGSRGSSFGPCIWPGPRGLLNQHIYRVKPRGVIEKTFLYYTLKSITGVIERRAHGFKDSLVHLRKAELTNWRVVLPPAREQRRISAILQSLDDRLLAEQGALVGHGRAKSALLDSLLSGRIRVTPSAQEAA